MSAVRETLIFCDGAEGGVLANDFSCPMSGPYGDGDTRSQTAAQQRSTFSLNGWLRRGGKDYCPACAKRLFGHMGNTDIGGSSQVENDCEDQGFTLIKDGCFACLPDFDAKGKRVRPKLEKLERDGKWWWTCPKCKGSYGAARTPRIRK